MLRPPVAVTGWQVLLLAVGITVAIYALFVGWLLIAGRSQDARALAGFIPDCVVCSVGCSKTTASRAASERS